MRVSTCAERRTSNVDTNRPSFPDRCLHPYPLSGGGGIPCLRQPFRPPATRGRRSRLPEPLAPALSNPAPPERRSPIPQYSTRCRRTARRKPIAGGGALPPSRGKPGQRGGSKSRGGSPPKRDEAEHEILFQKFFKSVGPRTYAAQVKRADNGNHYLVLTEGKRDEATGEVRKTRLFVFSEDFVEFFRLIKSAAEFIKANPVPTRRHAEAREVLGEAGRRRQARGTAHVSSQHGGATHELERAGTPRSRRTVTADRPVGSAVRGAPAMAAHAHVSARVKALTAEGGPPECHHPGGRVPRAIDNGRFVPAYGEPPGEAFA